jgi:molecular chaperone GrpE
VSNNNRFLNKLKDFIFGPPIPVLSPNDLQNLAELRQHLEALSRPEEYLPEPGRTTQPELNLEELATQVRKLGKTQFKANTLQESQLEQQQTALNSLQKTIARQEELITALTQQHEQAIRVAQLELLKSLLPILDSLDAAFDNGRRQVLRLPMSQEARQALIAWLDGLRLARLRLLDLLAGYEIKPIPTIGHPFDPHWHVAVATDTSGHAPDGIIVSEDQRGYAAPSQILRFAEVVVARSPQAPSPQNGNQLVTNKNQVNE